MVIGALIIFFLIVEPHGLARLWQIGKQKLRVWPISVRPIDRVEAWRKTRETASREDMRRKRKQPN
jgi:hypothetical protein